MTTLQVETAKQPYTLAQLRALKDDIITLAERYGASNVRVFGSVARGEATPSSDVDLLVHFREGASIFDEIGLWLDLQNLLGCEVDLSADDTLKEYIRPQVLNEVVSL